MNISKADAIAYLAKWYDARTEIRITHTTVTGNLFIVGQISKLNDSAITVTGEDSELLLYFRATSEYRYDDSRALPTEANQRRINKYPTIISIKFATGDRTEISEFFRE